jgi:hypothetical protein
MSQLSGMSKTPTTAVKFRVVGKIRAFCFLPSLIEASRAAWCGAPLEMTEGTTSGARVQSAFKGRQCRMGPASATYPQKLVCSSHLHTATKSLHLKPYKYPAVRNWTSLPTVRFCNCFMEEHKVVKPVCCKFILQKRLRKWSCKYSN